MLLFLAIAALLATPIAGDSCASYAHPQYGKTGRCIRASDCPNSLYISNLCESQPADVKCCFSASTTTGTGGCPTIVSRAGWGARAATSRTTMSTPVSYVVIHHTTGGTCTTKDSCISKMKGFQNYHMDSNGWADIGYTFLVGEDGNVYEGRGWTLAGAHCIGYNSKSIGISVIGDYTSRKPTTATLNAVKALIQCGISKGYIRSNYILRGHRDLDATSCPGNAFYAEIKTWSGYRSTERSALTPSFNVPEDYLVMKDMSKKKTALSNNSTPIRDTAACPTKAHPGRSFRRDGKHSCSTISLPSVELTQIEVTSARIDRFARSTTVEVQRIPSSKIYV